MPDESIDCIVTSPPYWALRDYGVEGQIGLEETYQEYIAKLVAIFDEVKRVLRSAGTCWVNLGDSYMGKTTGEMGDNAQLGGSRRTQKVAGGRPDKKGDLPEKCLAQIPSRFALAMTDNGWILRNEIIWYKPNCMPASVTDRFTVDFEKVFFFVKQKKYWFEQQKETSTYTDSRANKGRVEYENRNTKCGVVVSENRNKRAVWKVPTKPYRGAHFATYPQDLIEPMIRAGCPQGGGGARPFHGERHDRDSSA